MAVPMRSLRPPDHARLGDPALETQRAVARLADARALGAVTAVPEQGGVDDYPVAHQRGADAAVAADPHVFTKPG